MSFIREVRSDIEREAVRLLREYRSSLFREAVRLCGDVHTAEDLVMRTIETFFAKREDELPPDDKTYSWLRTTLQNLYWNMVRTKAYARTVYVNTADAAKYRYADRLHMLQAFGGRIFNFAEPPVLFACNTWQFDDYDKYDAELFDVADIIVCPTTLMRTLKKHEEISNEKGFTSDLFSIVCNLTGIPAITIPMGRDCNGIPVGLQIMAIHNREEDLFAFAYSVEKALKNVK